MLSFLLPVPVAYAGNIFILTENVIPEDTALPESHINDVSWVISLNGLNSKATGYEKVLMSGSATN